MSNKLINKFKGSGCFPLHKYAKFDVNYIKEDRLKCVLKNNNNDNNILMNKRVPNLTDEIGHPEYGKIAIQALPF